MSFWSDYLDLYDGEEQQICCPFPHRDNAGHEFYETNPSCSVKLDDGANGGVFNCFACGRHGSISEMVAELLGCKNPKKIEQLAQMAQPFPKNWEDNRDNAIRLGIELGFDPQVMEEVNVSVYDNDSEEHIVYPVMFGKYLTDMRKYKPNAKPKVRSLQHAIAGQIIPWSALDGPIIVICEGEKDMMMARTHGLNACTLTGGAGTLCLYPALFKGKRIRICYDNDDAGRKGAVQLANQLLPYAEEVKVITAFHAYVGEKGDIYDFLSNNSVETLKEFMRLTPVYTEKTKIISELDRYKLTTLKASAEELSWIKAKVQCVSIEDIAYDAPERATYLGNTWSLKARPESVIQLIHPATEKNRMDYFLNYFGIKKEEYNNIQFEGKVIIYKCIVADRKAEDGSVMPWESTCYLMSHQIDPGKNYIGLFKHLIIPVKGYQHVLLGDKLKQDVGFTEDLIITDKTMEALDAISNLGKSPIEIIDKLDSDIHKSLNYKSMDYRLLETIDLTFNSPLEIPTKHGNKRGCLDTIIISESRTGKSSTCEHLIETYGVGAKISLAGSAATPTAITGGSQSVQGVYRTRAGVLPKNNKGLIVFEELAKANTDIIPTLTEIRSSGIVRINRVAGEMTLEAKLRMITLTNPKKQMSIAAHSNGLEVLTDLVGRPEDVARYDLALIMAKEDELDHLHQETNINHTYLKERTQWVWTRTIDQILYTQEALELIETAAEQLNEDFTTQYQIISGNEAWLKVQRLATACAARCASHSDDYSSILVTDEHVSWAYIFLTRLYNNNTFRLKEVADKYKDLITCTEADVKGLEKIGNKHYGYELILNELFESATIDRTQLQDIGYLDKDRVGFLLAQLSKHHFITRSGDRANKITGTEKFRKAYQKATFKDWDEEDME